MLCLLVTNFPIILTDMDAAMMVIQKQLPRTKKTAFLAIKLDSVAVLMARDMLEMRKRRRDAEVRTFFVHKYVYKFKEPNFSFSHLPKNRVWLLSKQQDCCYRARL